MERYIAIWREIQQYEAKNTNIERNTMIWSEEDMEKTIWNKGDIGKIDME
jgi:hypothetical protein